MEHTLEGGQEFCVPFTGEILPFSSQKVPFLWKPHPAFLV